MSSVASPALHRPVGPVPLGNQASPLVSGPLSPRSFRSARPSPAGRRPLTNPTTDAQLLRRVAEGDDEALRELYRRYGRLAYSLAYRMLGRDDRAEEVVQEAFLRVWRHADRFDETRASFATWFARLVRNHCIDLLRHHEPLDRAASLPHLDHYPGQTEPIDPAIIDRLVIREAFLRLPIDQSRVLELAYFQGLTHREIAKSLEIPEGTVKSRLRLGLQRLRLLLQDGSEA